MKKAGVLLVLALILSQVVFLGEGLRPAEVSAATTTYYVATDGSNTNAGTTIDSPFRTIQRCADVAQAGDTCVIRGGTYRETITVPRSGTEIAPITFQAYAGEAVVVSGADLLTGWTAQGGGRYTATMPWDLDVRRAFTGEGPQVTGNQLFVDGTMMPQARWPNLTPAQQTQQGKCTMAQADGSSVANEAAATYYDAGLSEVPAGTFNGGKITFAPGDNLIYTSCDVTNQTGGAVSFHCDTEGFDAPGLGAPGTMLGPSAANYYYLWGTLAALDAPGEWFRDGATGVVTLQMPDGGAPDTRVEARRRLWAFDLRGRSYIVLDGIQLFAATVRYSDTTLHTTLQNLEVRYPWHFQMLPPLFWAHGTHGIQVLGQYNTIRDSLLAYSAGSMIALGGTHNRAVNNVIYEATYMGISGAVVGSVNNIFNPGGASRNEVTQNTVFVVGRIGVAADPGLDITYNDLYRSHLQTSDLGTIYAWGSDGKNAAIAYNLVHDNSGELNVAIRCFGGHGIYLDDNTTHYQIYRNIVWNTTAPGIFVFGGDAAHTPSNRQIFNNTVDAKLAAWAKAGQSLEGTAYRNNIGRVIDLHQAGLVADHNLEGDGLYVDRAGRDYRPRHYAPAVDAGVDLGSPAMDPPMTPVGTPDIGALEYGRAPFVAGALVRERDLATLTVSCEQTSDSTATCTLDALPVGRKVPPDLQVRIGNSGATAQGCATQMDYDIDRGVATCTEVPTNGLSGSQPVYVRLGSGTWVARGTLDLGPLALYELSPASGLSAGGTRVLLSGRRFDVSVPGYQRTVSLANSTGSPLYTYPVPVTLDTRALISAGKLRGDCGDLRFYDGYGPLSYWLASGCNTAATRVWVKVPVIPAGTGVLTMTYGNPTLPGISDGRGTFFFFDDFEDGVLSPTVWSAGSTPQVTISETEGTLRIAGSTSSGTQYAEFGAHLEDPDLIYPETFAIDAKLRVLSGPATFKANVGAADSVLALWGSPAGSPLGKSIGYFSGGWQAVGQSTVGAGTFDWTSFSIGYTGAEGSRTVRWMENGNVAQPRAVRSGLSYPDVGYFTYGPDGVASFDARFDDVRVRPFVYPEPAVSLGPERGPSVQVTLGGAACRNVVVEGPTRLACTAPSHAEGPVDVVVTNPGGVQATLQDGFTFLATLRAYLPVVMR